MNLKSKLVTAAGLGVAGAVLTGGVAMAAPAPAPHVYKAVTQLPQRGDGGDASTWSTDHETRVLTIKQVGAAIPGISYQYVATVQDKGTFKTNTNVLAPNQHAPFAGLKTGHFAINGSMSGQASYSFTTTKPVSNHPNLGVPGYENDHGNYVGSPAVNSTTDWYQQAFPAGTVFGGTGIQNNWKWTYNANVLTGYHNVTTWHKVFTGYKWEFVPVWHNNHKSLKWERVAQFKYIPHTVHAPTYKHETYVDANTEIGEIAGL